MTYIIYDERALADEDKASVMDIAETLDEAKREAETWEHCVIVEYEDTEPTLTETGRKWHCSRRVITQMEGEA